MSSNLPYKQAANVERRTWDKETYEAKAKARIAAESSGGSGTNTGTYKKRPLPPSHSVDVVDVHGHGNDGNDETTNQKEEFQAAEVGAAGPWRSKRAFLKARREKVDLESKIGTTEIINPDAAAVSCTVTASDSDSVAITDGVKKGVNGVGWHCEVCDCFLKDSLAYLDHINGRKHQRKLGYSMRIAQSTTDEVASKLAYLAKEQNEKKKDDFIGKDDEKEDVDAFEEMVKKKDEEIAQRKAERAKRREERKRRARGEMVEPVSKTNEAETKVKGDQDEDEEDEHGGVNPDIMAMMGFSGFG